MKLASRDGSFDSRTRRAIVTEEICLGERLVARLIVHVLAASAQTRRRKHQNTTAPHPSPPADAALPKTARFDRDRTSDRAPQSAGKIDPSTPAQTPAH